MQDTVHVPPLIGGHSHARLHVTANSVCVSLLLFYLSRSLADPGGGGPNTAPSGTGDDPHAKLCPLSHFISSLLQTNSWVSV